MKKRLYDLILDFSKTQFEDPYDIEESAFNFLRQYEIENWYMTLAEILEELPALMKSLNVEKDSIEPNKPYYLDYSYLYDKTKLSLELEKHKTREELISFVFESVFKRDSNFSDTNFQRLIAMLIKVAYIPKEYYNRISDYEYILTPEKDTFFTSLKIFSFIFVVVWVILYVSSIYFEIEWLLEALHFVENGFSNILVAVVFCACIVCYLVMELLNQILTKPLKSTVLGFAEYRKYKSTYTDSNGRYRTRIVHIYSYLFEATLSWETIVFKMSYGEKQKLNKGDTVEVYVSKLNGKIVRWN